MTIESNQEELQKRLERLYEQKFWTPCRSKKELQQWLETFLSIRLPDKVVSSFSNSNPMDFIWEVYESGLTGNPNKTTFVVAASRNSAKTLCASVLEFLFMVHLGRNIVHLAAILDQSIACIDYLDRFLDNPIINKHFKSDNKRLKLLRSMPVNEYKKSNYAKLKVITATKKGANSSRASLLIFDETDLIDKDILSESTFIADPDANGRPPIFVYLSSRKTAVGPMQEKINLSEDPANGIHLHRWNVTDWTKPCLPERHLPELPRIDLFIHKETLAVLDIVAHTELSESMKDSYDLVPAYEGCRKCPIFVTCRTDAINQTSTSPNLRTVDFVGNLIREVADSDKINAQLINLRPESGGVVYNKFDKDKHYQKVQECWNFAFNVYPTNHDGSLRIPTKKEFIQELRNEGWRLNCGVDFGWVDYAAAVLVAYQKSSDKLLVLHVETAPGISNQDWLVYVKNRIYDVYGFDLVCPDTADKSSPTFAASIGMPSRGTKPPRIETGVSWIRTRLWNASKQEAQFMILDDPYNTLSMSLVKDMESWQYLKTAMGFDFNHFADDDFTHRCDALRYAIDPFISSQVSHLAGGQKEHENTSNPVLADSVDGMKKLIDEHMYKEYGIRVNPSQEEKIINAAGGITICF